MIALLKYSIAVHSIPCKANANLFYTVTCVNTRRPHGYIAKRVIEWNPQGNGKRARPQQAHKIGRAGGETVGKHKWTIFVPSGTKRIA